VCRTDRTFEINANMCLNHEVRWQTAGDAPDGLFPVMELFDAEHGTGRMARLEFLPVLARTVLNRVPPSSRADFRWTINAYRGCSHACRYCFARPTHEYLGLSAGDDFDRKIVVKVNAVDVVRAELSDPRWGRERVAMGTNTDPYQPAEAKFRLTRGIIAALSEARTPFSVLTKSPLVTRDLDLLIAARRTMPVSVSFSIGTIDEDVWRVTEPGTPHPLRRVDAMRVMADAGIETGALVAPILPGLSDRRDQIERTVAAIRGAGGQVIGSSTLYLRGATRDHFLAWLSGHDPDLHRRYLRAFGTGSHVSERYRQWVREAIASAIAQR
jgi:DNA repair photolyase